MTVSNDRLPAASVHGILQTVADREGVDVAELPPVYDVLDPDALEEILRTSRTGTLSVEFSYSGYDIRVSRDGDVSVTVSEARPNVSSSPRTIRASDSEPPVPEGDVRFRTDRP